jgi:hypothetical protein
MFECQPTVIKNPRVLFGNDRYFPLKFYSQLPIVCFESLWRTLCFIIKGWPALWCGPPNFFGEVGIVFQPLALFIAQHATATCCRGCISKWHGIEKGRALNGAEVDYVVAMIMGWIEEQIIFSQS